MRTESLFSNEKQHGTAQSIKLSAYVPVLILFAVSAVTALSIALGFGGAVGMSIHAFMGFGLSSFALLKLLDLPGFARAFALCDLLARRWRGYGYLYAVLELGLGLAFFSYVAPVPVYVATVILFAYNTVSAMSAMERGAAVAFPHMRAPLPAVMALESTVMIVMALVLLWL